MPEIIRSVHGRCASEKTIEKSRFLSYCAHVTSEEEARAFIAEIRGMHPTATHNCYGFVADKTGAMQRFSDDGEPQGTAGMPILDVIKNKGLFETAVVVTRYFGGIKLGAGGLVRAYTSACAEVLDKAQICLWQTCVELSVCVDYPQIDAALKFFNEHDCIVKTSDYSDKVYYTLLVKKTDETGFISALTDYLLGKVICQKIDEYFYPFLEEK
ncbi:MAG: YigZ family protein [Clostridia bacterium]|nr:YigZ family protein [Clostridia bacterium]